MPWEPLFTFVYARRIERRYPPTGRFLEVEGRRLHYVDDGPERDAARGTVVLLHGASSNLVESMLGLGARSRSATGSSPSTGRAMAGASGRRA